jgi:hypothetical protein
MNKFTMTHQIHCDAETFWKVFLDKKFNETLFTGPMGFPDFKVTEQTETGTTISRKVSAQPKMEVPGAVQKLLGDGFRYTEEGSMNKSERVWGWKIIPSTLADRIHTSGAVRVEPSGEHEVRRITEVSVEAKIFGLGGLLESTAEKELRKIWDKSAEYMNKWVAEHEHHHHGAE